MTRFEKGSVLVGSAFTAGTGILYFAVKYLMEPADPWAVVNHPSQTWLLKAHILVAPLLVFAVGAIAVRHVWEHFSSRIRQGRRSGIGAAVAVLPMVITGYLIQVVTQQFWLAVVAWTHIVTGALFSVAVLAHYRATRRKPAAAPDAGEHRHPPRIRLPLRRSPRHR